MGPGSRVNCEVLVTRARRKALGAVFGRLMYSSVGLISRMPTDTLCSTPSLGTDDSRAISYVALVVVSFTWSRCNRSKCTLTQLMADIYRHSSKGKEEYTNNKTKKV